MTKHDFETLLQLTRIKPQGIAARGAEMVLVHGLTQIEASQVLDCSQATISRAVRTLKDRQRIARQVS